MKPTGILLLLGVAFGFCPAARAITWHVPSQYPTIQAGIHAASAGDTVLVACGVYSEASISMRSGVCLRSETGQPDCVVIDAVGLYGPGIYCDQVDSARIEGFTITHAEWEWGGGIACLGSSVLIANCILRNNDACYWQGGGITSEQNSSVAVHSCIFVGNRAYEAAGAVTVWYNSSASLTDCIFIDNHAPWAAILCWEGSSLTLRNCTLYDHATGGIALTYSSSLIIENTIITRTEGYYALVYSSSCTASLTCLNMFDNPYGDWFGPLVDFLGVDGNISVCPRFCDPLNQNFHLQSCSPCAPGNHPQGYDCGLIGAFDVGCECGMPSRVQPTTWSSLKELYR